MRLCISGSASSLKGKRGSLGFKGRVGVRSVAGGGGDKMALETEEGEEGMRKVSVFAPI